MFSILLLAASCQSVEKTPQEASFSLVFPVIVDSYSHENDYGYGYDEKWEFSNLGYRAPVLPLDDYDSFNPFGFDSTLAVGVNF